MQPAGIFSESYKQDMAIVRTRLQWGLLIVFLALLFCLPLFLGGQWLSLIIVISITCITVLGLNIVTGLCGQISLGQAAFMAVGAYTAGILATKFGLPFWITLPLAGVSAALVGLVFGVPSLRVKGFYLLLTTLAAQFIITWLILHLEITGGPFGLSLPKASLGGIVFASDQSYYYIAVALTVLMTILAKNIVRTRAGRAFIAIRDNDLAAEVMGINIFGYKLMAFAIASFYAGIAGCLWAYYIGYITTEHFTLIDSVCYLGMIIVGGAGSTLGAILGTVFLRGLRQLMDSFMPVISGWFPPGMPIGIIPALNLAPYAIIIIVFLIFEPRGLAHRWELFKASYRLWPYSH